MKHKFLFYLLSITWGLPLTLAGFLTATVLLATGHRPQRRCGCWYFNIGKSRWGGLNLGLVILCQPNASGSLKNHEFGHAIQNCRFGPIMLIFVVGSAIRYHYINHLEKLGLPTPDYDSWWFEGQATELGTLYTQTWR